MFAAIVHLPKSVVADSSNLEPPEVISLEAVQTDVELPQQNLASVVVLLDELTGMLSLGELDADLCLHLPGVLGLVGLDPIAEFNFLQEHEDHLGGDRLFNISDDDILAWVGLRVIHRLI